MSHSVTLTSQGKAPTVKTHSDGDALLQTGKKLTQALDKFAGFCHAEEKKGGTGGSQTRTLSVNLQSGGSFVLDSMFKWSGLSDAEAAEWDRMFAAASA